MAYRSMEAKVIETIKFSCLPSYPDAISWSLDDRVSIITDKCVYILVSFSYYLLSLFLLILNSASARVKSEGCVRLTFELNAGTACNYVDTEPKY